MIGIIHELLETKWTATWEWCRLIDCLYDELIDDLAVNAAVFVGPVSNASNRRDGWNSNDWKFLIECAFIGVIHQTIATKDATKQFLIASFDVAL